MNEYQKEKIRSITEDLIKFITPLIGEYGHLTRLDHVQILYDELLMTTQGCDYCCENNPLPSLDHLEALVQEYFAVGMNLNKILNYLKGIWFNQPQQE